MRLVEGASWTYTVDDGTEVTDKTQSVGPLEDIGGEKAGTLAYRLTTTKPGGQTISWQEDTGDAVRRHRELDMSGDSFTDEIYQPYRTRIDETAAHTAEGATWSESYTELVTDADDVTTTADKVETWTVVAVDEAITVPAGDFCTIHLDRSSTVGGVPGSMKSYWFARGVGKVKEAGENQTEELVSFTTP